MIPVVRCGLDATVLRLFGRKNCKHNPICIAKGFIGNGVAVVSEVEFLGLRAVFGIGIVTEDFCCKTKTPEIDRQ